MNAWMDMYFLHVFLTSITRIIRFPHGHGRTRRSGLAENNGTLRTKTQNKTPHSRTLKTSGRCARASRDR